MQFEVFSTAEEFLGTTLTVRVEGRVAQMKSELDFYGRETVWVAIDTQDIVIEPCEVLGFEFATIPD